MGMIRTKQQTESELIQGMTECKKAGYVLPESARVITSFQISLPKTMYKS